MQQLYARVFLQILDSSIAEDFFLRHVFEDLIKLASKNGVVDITREAMARRLNLPLEKLNEALKRLESPDPKSRDPENDGRRIELLDGHRDWGWQILNWSKYDALRTKADVALRVATHRQKRKQGTGKTEHLLPINLPSGFPKDEKEAAAHASFAGVADDFAIHAWNKAMSRNGNDAKGQPIRSFRHYLATEKVYARDREKPNKSESKQIEEVIHVKSL